MSSSHRAGSIETDETIETEANTDGNVEDVYFTKEVFELRESDAFLGACMDSAAQKTVIGKEQAQAYCDFSNISFELRDDTPVGILASGLTNTEASALSSFVYRLMTAISLN